MARNGNKNSLACVIIFMINLESSLIHQTSASAEPYPVQRSPERLLQDEPLEEEDEAVEANVLKYKSKEHSCTYFYHDRFPSEEAGLVNCSWYTSKSCCKRTEVTSVFANMYPLYGASKTCRNLINYLMCFFCSPEQHKFYKSNKKVMVCPDFCDSIYDECKTAGFKKELIGEAYKNGTTFCEAQDFYVVDSADSFKFDPTVFGGSHIVLPHFCSVIFVFIVLILVLIH